MANSPAAKAGLWVGDVLEMVHRTKVFSQGDVMAALHEAPPAGKIPLIYRRAGKATAVELEVPKGWKKTDLSWRPSMVK